MPLSIHPYFSFWKTTFLPSAQTHLASALTRLGSGLAIAAKSGLNYCTEKAAPGQCIETFVNMWFGMRVMQRSVLKTELPGVVLFFTNIIHVLVLFFPIPVASALAIQTLIRYADLVYGVAGRLERGHCV